MRNFGGKFPQMLKPCVQTLSDWTNHISIALSPFRWRNFRFGFVAFFFLMSWETFMEKPPNSLNPKLMSRWRVVNLAPQKENFPEVSPTGHLLKLTTSRQTGKPWFHGASRKYIFSGYLHQHQFLQAYGVSSTFGVWFTCIQGGHFGWRFRSSKDHNLLIR